MSGTLRVAQGYVQVEWEIEIALESEESTYFSSPLFFLSNGKWYLQINSYGETGDETAGMISLYLCNGDPEKKWLPSVFTMGIRKSDGSVYKSFSRVENRDIKHGKGYGYSNFVSRSKLFELKDVLLPEDKLQVFCVAYFAVRNVAESANQTVKEEGFETLIKNFTKLCRKGSFGDVLLRVQDREFPAHRSILAARSPVFYTMFTHDTAEKKSGVVNITDCDPTSFEDFLLHVYTGKVDKISSDNVFDLYKAADKYDLKGLKAKCTHCMACDLSVDSFCDCVLLAVEHAETELLESATEFFINNIETILLTRKWQLLMKDHHTIANELFIKMVNMTKLQKE